MLGETKYLPGFIPDPLPQLEKNPLEGAGEAWMEVIGAMMRGENPTMISDEENMRNQGLEPYDPPVRMRREFRLEKQVKRARLFVTAHGIYEARIIFGEDLRNIMEI